MIGLLLKDIYLMKGVLRFYLLVFVLFTVLAALGVIDVSFVAMYTGLMVIMMPVSTFSLDEQARWSGYAAALPGGRGAVVSAKYLFLLVMIAAGLLLGLACGLLAGMLNGGAASVGTLLPPLAAIMVCGLVFNLILLPVVFRIGAEKGRYVMIILFFVIFAAAALAVREFGLPEPAQLAPKAFPAVLLLILLFAASYAASRFIYRRKEL